MILGATSLSGLLTRIDNAESPLVARQPGDQPGRDVQVRGPARRPPARRASTRTPASCSRSAARSASDRRRARRASAPAQLDQGADRDARGRGARTGAAAPAGGPGAGRRGSSRTAAARPEPDGRRKRLDARGRQRPAGLTVRQPGRPDRDVLPRGALRLGRRHAERLRLLGSRDVLPSPSSASPSPTPPTRCGTTASPSPRTSSSPVTWSSSRPRPRRPLHRRRRIRQRALHRSVVSVASLDTGWAAANYVGARRIT